MNNGVRHSKEKRTSAQYLRKHGYTHREISEKLSVSVGITHIWTQGIAITKKQKDEIEHRRILKYQSKFAEYLRNNRDAVALRIKKNLGPFQYRQKYTKEELIQSICDFFFTHNRIPLKRERGNSRIYRIRFGTWNAAVREAGFKPNPELFSHKCKAEDGHVCDSFSEKIIDDWLVSRGIRHERSFPYKGTRMTADFFLPPNTVIEFFGLAGVQKKYDALIKKKQRLAKKLKLNLIEMYPSDLHALVER